MSQIVPYTEGSPFRLEQTCNGHVVTPWFSLADFSGEEMRDWSGRYYLMIAEAKRAAAAVLGLRENDFIVTQMNDPEHGPKWRLGTIHKCALPTPKRLPPSDPLAIDI